MNESSIKNEEGKEIIRSQKVRLYKVKHFLFDFGGVMIEKTFVLNNLFSILENDFKIKIPNKETDVFLKKLRRRLSSGLISSRQFLEKLLEKFIYPFQSKNGALPPKQANIEYYLELWFDLYSQVSNISLDMAEIVERLHQAGYVVSLLSNTYDIHAKSNELRGFYDMFDNVFLSNEIGLIKPDLEKYKHVLNKLNTDPKKCIFIDDKISNLIPASELGIIVIRFESFKKLNLILNGLGILELSPNFRKNIKRQYEIYKTSKIEYYKAKKAYKKAKKAFLKHNRSKKKVRKNRLKYQKKREIYENKKQDYKNEKVKKKELIKKIKME
jgi:epoxide hydrolase-like predicted phosphatase